MFGQSDKFTLEAASAYKIVLTDARAIPAVFPYYEPDNLAQIPDHVPLNMGDRSRDMILRALNKPMIQLEESAVYHLKESLICRGSLLCAGLRHDLKYPPKKDMRLPPLQVRHVPKGCLAHNQFSAIYWGHWLSNELPMQMRLQSMGKLLGYLPRTAFRDEVFWRNKLGLAAIEQAEAWAVGDLLVRSGYGWDVDTIQQYHHIRNLLGVPRKGDRRILLLRGSVGEHRVLVNEQELVARLQAEGFQCLSTGTSSGEQIAAAMHGASVIVSVEGSHLAPFMYSIADDGLLIVLQPPGRVGLNQNSRASFCGVPSAIYVCRQAGDDFSTFSVEPDLLLGFIDRATRWGIDQRDRFAAFADAAAGNAPAIYSGGLVHSS